jgi:hypothetical protein
VKLSKNWIPPQNNLAPNATLSKGLAMFCAYCTMMGSAINLVLIPSRSTTCKVMNEIALLNPKDNPQFHYLSYNSILIN